MTRALLLIDPCAARELEHSGVRVPGEHVHAAFIAALADGYAEVVEAHSFQGRE